MYVTMQILDMYVCYDFNLLVVYVHVILCVQDSQQSFNFKFSGQSSTISLSSSFFRSGSKQSISSANAPPPVKGTCTMMYISWHAWLQSS